jgi:hypothetical protein
MELNATHMDVAYLAYAASLDGHGIVVKDTAVPEAHALCERGWLERRFTDTGELAWFWTAAGDIAMSISGLQDAYHRN